MYKPAVLRATISAAFMGAWVLGCSDSADGPTDTGSTVDMGSGACPSGTITSRFKGAGTFNGEPFTFDCTYDRGSTDAVYRASSGEGRIECDQPDAQGDIEIAVDIIDPPTEGVITDTSLMKIEATSSTVSQELDGDFTNRLTHSITITCWEPEAQLLVGTFSATWADDGDRDFITKLTAYGDISGDFTVELTGS